MSKLVTSAEPLARSERAVHPIHLAVQQCWVCCNHHTREDVLHGNTVPFQGRRNSVKARIGRMSIVGLIGVVLCFIGLGLGLTVHEEGSQSPFDDASSHPAYESAPHLSRFENRIPCASWRLLSMSLLLLSSLVPHPFMRGKLNIYQRIPPYSSVSTTCDQRAIFCPWELYVLENDCPLKCSRSLCTQRHRLMDTIYLSARVTSLLR